MVSELAQWLRGLAAHAENPGLVPSAHMLAYSQPAVTLVPGNLDALFWPPQARGTYMVHNMHAGKTHTHLKMYRKIKNSKYQLPLLASTKSKNQRLPTKDTQPCAANVGAWPGQTRPLVRGPTHSAFALLRSFSSR